MAALVQKNGLGAATQNNTDVYYGWSTYIVPGLEVINNYSHTVLVEWHGDRAGGMTQAPIHWGVFSNGQWYLDLHRNATGYSPYFTQTFGAMQTGLWIDWVLRTKWSLGTDGVIQLWKNGVLLYTYQNATWNLAGPEQIYPIMGLYAPTGSTSTAKNFGAGTVYHDCARIGTTRAIVDPASY